MGLIKPYVQEEEWKENIRKYKYKGTDNSIFYVYVVSPLCNYLVELLPTWLA